MIMRRLIQLVIFYFLIFSLFSISYIALFHTPIFMNQKVLFYRGLLLLCFNFFIFFLILYAFYLKKIISYSWETIIASLIISVSFNLAFFVVFPVTFERSVTMYLLKKIAHKKISKKELEKNLINEYIIKNNALDKRINEQKVIDFIKEKDGYLWLTRKAKKFIDFSKIIGHWYNLKN
jgi:hypothetical protein